MTNLARVRNFSILTYVDHSKSTLADGLIQLVGMATEHEHAVHLPARREDTFKRAPREEDTTRQTTLDL